MKYIIFFLLCILVGCAKSVAQPIRVEAPKPEALPKETLIWHDFSNKIFKEAQKDYKVVLVQVEIDDDEQCEMMREITFKNQKVIHMLNENYIAISVNGYEYRGVFGIFPTTLFMTPSGREFGRIEGVVLWSEFSEILAEVNEHLFEIFETSPPENGIKIE